MLRLEGIPISDEHAREIATALVADDTARALDLANRITTCLRFRAISMDLTGRERATLLAVLDDPDDEVGDLRGVLARDWHRRQRTLLRRH